MKTNPKMQHATNENRRKICLTPFVFTFWRICVFLFPLDLFTFTKWLNKETESSADSNVFQVN